MLEHLEALEAAQSVENAVRRVLAAGATLPRDLGGTASTEQVTAAVLHSLV